MWIETKTMTNADNTKEWQFERQKYFTNGFKKGIAIPILIPNDCIDQLRRDAQLEQVKIDFENNLKLLDAEVLRAKKEKFDEIINLIKKDEKEYLEKHDIIIGFYCRGLVEELNSTIKKSIERREKKE